MCVPTVAPAFVDIEQLRSPYYRWPLLKDRAGGRPRACVQDPEFSMKLRPGEGLGQKEV